MQKTYRFAMIFVGQIINLLALNFLQVKPPFQKRYHAPNYPCVS